MAANTHRVMAVQEEGSEINMHEGTQNQCYDWIHDNIDEHIEFQSMWVESIQNANYLTGFMINELGIDPAMKYGFEGDY